MAHVTLPDGRELDVDDSETTKLDYYRGEGATIEGVAEAVTFPVVFVGGEEIVPPPYVPPGEYDPSQHTVPEVNDYLDSEDVDDAERARVLGLEAAGEARKGILGD
jgi:hypothetical protein